jgi:hypothetical protein
MSSPHISVLAAAIMALGLPVHQGWAGECRVSPVPAITQATLFSYVAKNGTNDDDYTVAGMGNEFAALGTDLKPMPVAALATLIRSDPKFTSVKRVRLEWPYSSRGAAPYARDLEMLVGKPVVGYPGAVWWYADGTLIASSGDNGRESGPAAAEVTECAKSDGTLLAGAECQDVFAAHRTQSKIFANAPFDLSCEEINQLEIQSDQGDRKATALLLRYHQFVNRDTAAEEKYTARPR